MIREEVGLVFNMSNIEMNMSDSEGVSGRSTSESLETIDQNKGVIPIINIITNTLNRSILPYRYGAGYKVEFQVAKDPMQELQMQKAMIDSKLYSINEVRTEELGRDPFEGEEYDKPMGTGQGEEGMMGDEEGGMGGLEDLMGGL